MIGGDPRTSATALSQHHVRAVVATVLAGVAAVDGAVAARRLVLAPRGRPLAASGLAWTGLAGGRINHPEVQAPGHREGGPARPH